MQTINFSDYETTNEMGYNFYRAFKELQGKNNVRLVFDKKVYEIMPDYCLERNLCCSNHGFNGPKRIAALIEDAHNIELDFRGATIRCVGAMIHFAVLNSSCITIKNLILENPKTQIMQGKVIAHGEGYIDILKMNGSEQFLIRNGELVVPAEDFSLFPVYSNVHFNAETGEIGHNSTDKSFGVEPYKLRCESLSDEILRFYGVERFPTIGDIVVFNASRRVGSGFFCRDSSDLFFENVTIHSCFGMGLIAQMCENITLNSFNTVRKDEQYYTANADATHFVQCSGTVKVENSTFEGQLDDALNIHGMYTKILNKSDNELFVREMHEQSRGIQIYRNGDKIQILNPDSLIPYTEKTIKLVEYLNEDVIRLLLEETTEEVNTSDIVENISRNANLIFNNNVVRNHRARGMLIATRGKTLIENCYFHSSSSSIIFESNGKYWFESGATSDVTIKGNHFDKCKYAYPFRKGIIACIPRENIEKEKYFHNQIKIVDNKFSIADDNYIFFDNVENVVFTGNTFDKNINVVVNHVCNYDIQTDVEITKEKGISPLDI